MASDSTSRSGVVLELAEEFLERHRAGERPALREYVDRHPELADEIREVFPLMAMMENIALADETLDARDVAGATPPAFEQLGDYRVVREVGRGGMGVVYEAEQVSLGRHVALKVLPPQSLRDPKQRRRFEREAKAAARLHHTNIVPVFGVGKQDEMPYYVMQFIQGQGLDAVLDELKRLRVSPRLKLVNGLGTIGSTIPYEGNGNVDGRELSAADVAQSLLTGRFGSNGDGSQHGNDAEPATSPATGSGSDLLSSSSLSLPSGAARGRRGRPTYWEGVAKIGQQVAEALAYAHGQGVIHRDIKPSNLLLDTKGTVWVADFGLAKAADQQDLTHSGDILGTLRYMPPEAFSGKSDSRSDIYSLGLTLYEMLAFRPAFDERDRGKLVKQVTNDEPPALKKLNPEVPRDLETIIQKAIDREPSHRYATAAELADDLRRFVADEPIQARRASVTEQLARWVRRNPAVASLMSAVAVLLLSIIGGLWQADRQARRALDLQTELRKEADRLASEALKSAELERQAKSEAVSEKQKVESANSALRATQNSLRSTLYAAQMNLTQAAWNSRNTSRTLDLLAAAVPKPGEPDLRGFEWHHWRRQLHGELTVHKFLGTDGMFLVDDAFSRDGSLLARFHETPGNSRLGSVLIYDTATYRLLHSLPITMPARAPDSRMVFRCSFSSDNQVLGAYISYPTELKETDPNSFKECDHDFVVIAWNVSVQRELFRETQRVHTSLAWTSVSVNGDGSKIATGCWLANQMQAGFPRSYSGRFRVLDVKQGRELFGSKLSDFGYVFTEFSPDGRLVATRGVKQTERLELGYGSRIIVYDVATGRPRFDPSGLESDGLGGPIHFSPDGRRLAAVGGVIGEVPILVVHDMETGRSLVKQNLSGFLVGTPEFTFGPDGRSIVMTDRASAPAEVRDVETGRLIRSLDLGLDGTYRLAVRRSDSRLLTMKGDYLREWNLPTAEPTSLDGGLMIGKVGRALMGTSVRPAVFAKGGRQLLVRHMPDDSTSERHGFSVHDVSNGQAVRRFGYKPAQGDSEAFIRWVQSDSAGKRVVSVISPRANFFDQTQYKVRVWDLADGRELLTLDRDRLGGFPATYPLSAQVWDGSGERLVLNVRNADLGPDGKTRMSSEWSVVIVEIPSGKIVRRIPSGTSFPIGSFCPAGHLLAIGRTVDGATGSVAKVDLVEVDTGRVVRQLTGDLASLGRVIFSPDGSRLAAASAVTSQHGSRILIWNLTSGHESVPVQINDSSSTTHIVTFSPDGHRLATGTFGIVVGASRQGEVKLWDTSSGNEVANWLIDNGTVEDLAFTTDGKQLRVASQRGMYQSEVSVTLLDASPLAPEVEAVDLVARLSSEFPLNAELVAKIEADTSVDPAIRAAAVSMASTRLESATNLRTKAASWLDVPAVERTPELMRRALAHAEQATRLMDSPTRATLRVLAEARYRNGKFAEALEAIGKAKARDEEATPAGRSILFRLEAILTMTEARLGHRAEAEAALVNSRRLWAEASPSAAATSPLLVEADTAFAAAFGR